ncbi:MAG: UDP-N-acetylglucosamine--LPS N-acetylglucosamine transferase [Methylococcales bacterium]|nr:UDP-N-acetylglucosamine--LPS N-acetylglucosamine transferase [Methylococcales bacterium]MCK5926324.1 UDP-N-acetylglucosamine--LPS N-acetylglucosamine transferase [Methylococcales bacterium]
MSPVETKRKKILFISSSGGHWIEILRLRAAFVDCDAHYISTDKSYNESLSSGQFYSVRDASRWDKIGLVLQALRIFYLLIIIRPDVVISTGAAVGFFGLLFAKKMRIKTIWVDSLANVEKMSLSGLKVRPYADLWLTQWQHLATEKGPYFHGAVL